MLQLIGFFPTQPRQINFQIAYQVAGGQWRLAGMNVGVANAPAPAAGAAPAPQAPSTSAPATPKAKTSRAGHQTSAVKK